MTERIRLTVDGRPVATEAGTSVAAALLNAGFSRFRTSVTGEGRGPLCAMGICFECRVWIDGVAERQACMVTSTPGMEVRTDGSRVAAETSRKEPPLEDLSVDVAVVGGGPAGIAAACRAAEAGARVAVLNEGTAPGGQIWRGQSRGVRAGRWLERFRDSGARLFSESSVVDGAVSAGGFVLLVDRPGGPFRVFAKKLVLATGARERFLPFPGWTLSGVLGVGAAQALLKSGGVFEGRNVVIAGTGPLLLPVAALMHRHGARVRLVAEQAPFGALARFARGLWRQPGKLAQAIRYRAGFAGVPYRTGTWVTSATGEGSIHEVNIMNRWRSFGIRCDFLFCGFGLVPNVELARLLGCTLEGGGVAVSELQETSLPGVYCAGEPTGVAGVDQALVEGEIAGLAAAGRGQESRSLWPSLWPSRARGRAFARALEEAFRPRDELRSLADADTVVCRCEDVRRGQLDPAWAGRQAKLYSRTGMGSCQGRVCGPALEVLFGWQSDTVRPPLKPISIGSICMGSPGTSEDTLEEGSPRG